MRQPSGITNDFGERGYGVVRSLIGAEEVGRLRRIVAELPVLGRRGGVRGVLARSPPLRDFAQAGPPALLAWAILGSRAAQPVKGTLFDKQPGANWKVPWHQDLTIAVSQRLDVPGYGAWSVKDGVHHVQPPFAVLEGLVAVRVHLDVASATNGALRVIPGSHRYGRLRDQQARHLRSVVPEVVCAMDAGSAMVMAPLLLHASSACRSPHHRRVLHFEYASTTLAEGLEWHVY